MFIEREREVEVEVSHIRTTARDEFIYYTEMSWGCSNIWINMNIQTGDGAVEVL